MYNEEDNASECIDRVINNIKSLKVFASLIVINDGSTDSTSKILLKKQNIYKKNIFIINLTKNKGYGAATKLGLTWALKNGYEWCLHMDSDLTNDPKYIKDFVKFVTQEFDCIKASRYIKGSKIVNVPYFRKIISYLGNYLASILFNVGIKDCTNGFRMVRLTTIKDIQFIESNFSIILEELYYLRKRNALFKEIPYTLTVRTNSKSHFRYNFKVFKDYLKYAFRAFLLSIKS